MKSINVYSLEGALVGKAELPDELVGAAVRTSVIHDVVRAEEAAKRQGTHSTKTRGDVSGGGKKPWKQKGTGRARHGSTRSPIWRHGGVVFGPHPRDYEMKINKKTKKLALAGALSARFSEERMIGLEPKGLSAPKTASIAKFLKAFEGVAKPLFVHTPAEEALAKSVRNIRNAKHSNVENISTRSIMLSDFVIFTQGAITAMAGEQK
ncbi:MAG: 50S ribosomal protein L4 [Candidatus Hydrogenedentota bacterium]